MRKFTLAATAAILATAGTAAYVASPAYAQMDGHKGWDRNATITWADAKAKADAAWTRLDVNGDGKLDQADRDAKVGQMFDRIDTNHDGAISRDEFIAHHKGMMDHGRMDRGKPGEMPPPPPGEGPMAGKGHGWRHGGPGGMGPDHGAMAMLKMADANNDGAVSRAEYDASVKAMFDKADANHDGKVTPEERRAAMMQMHGRMGGPGGQMNGGMGRGLGGDMMPPPPPGDDD